MPQSSSLELWDLDMVDMPERPPSWAVAALTTAELQRAARLRAGDDRSSFLMTRAALRTLLGGRLECPPEAVVIGSGPMGKPCTRGGVHFNVSHTRGRSLIALASTPVGVDVERADRDVDVEDTSRLALTATERAHLSRLSPRGRRRVLFTLWARKEAIAKGVGIGVHLAFASLDALGASVFVNPAQAGLNGVAGPWVFADLPLPRPFVAAVATAGSSLPQLHLRRWRERDEAPVGVPS